LIERTLLLIKPDAVERNLTGKIIDRLETSGFRVAQLRMLELTSADARSFYKVHEGKPFLDELVAFMSSGPIVAMMLEKESAVSHLRELIGATDPSKAACGTIRQCYAVDVTRNSVHASDSVENAAIELGFFFEE
jgi:nucleoside-diphosphate kinase